MDSQPAEAEQVQTGDEREGIEMQGGAAPVLDPVIRWRRDWDLAGIGGGNHGLISFGRERAAPGDQPTPFSQLRNALILAVYQQVHVATRAPASPLQLRKTA